MQNNDKDDMCLLDPINEESIISNLEKRYEKDKIYTNIGQTLVCLNPYKEVDGLYEQFVINRIKNIVLSGNAIREPHVYAIAAKAFQGLINQIPKQAVIISGQSGAGKTQSTKYCMQMLTSLSQHQQQQHPIERKILACNPILEAFGNSKTVRNENSSRFGKYVQIFFGPDRTIRGASIKSYLLEKSRVTNVSLNQRNFHIFYSLCEGYEGMKRPAEYKYLEQSQCFRAEGIDDRRKWEEIKAAMNELGFNQNEQQRIWDLLKTILDLGNIIFDDRSAPCKLSARADELQQLGRKLAISGAELQQMLLYTKIQVPRQESILKEMGRAECEANRNTLCKAIYNSIFNYILSKIQNELNPPIQAEDLYRSFRSALNVTGVAPISSRSQINILDIFGFQNFQNNSLQQLCINYTNEKLLDLYNRCVFDNQLDILREDGLQNQLNNIIPPTNAKTINLLDSIFSTIKDNTRGRVYTDQHIVTSFKDNKQKKFSQIEFDKFDKKLFIVKHSPCKVTYNVIGFKAKNQDKLTVNIENISANLFERETGGGTGRTLIQKFTTQISELMRQLENASKHYIRCIKPNEEKKNKVVRDTLVRQVRYLGVFQTIQIKRRVFPCRRTYEEMKRVFGPVFKETRGKTQREAVNAILKSVQAVRSLYLLGHRRVYMSLQLQQRIYRRVIEHEKAQLASTLKIQRYIKRKLRLKCFRSLGFQVIKRIQTLKKWGEKAEKVMFCSFEEICEWAKSRKIPQRVLPVKSVSQTLQMNGYLHDGMIRHTEGQPLSNPKNQMRLSSVHRDDFFRQYQQVKQSLNAKDDLIARLKIEEQQAIMRQLQLEEKFKDAKQVQQQIAQRLQQSNKVVFEQECEIYELKEELNQAKIEIQRLKLISLPHSAIELTETQSLKVTLQKEIQTETNKKKVQPFDSNHLEELTLLNLLLQKEIQDQKVIIKQIQPDYSKQKEGHVHSSIIQRNGGDSLSSDANLSQQQTNSISSEIVTLRVLLEQKEKAIMTYRADIEDLTNLNDKLESKCAKLETDHNIRTGRVKQLEDMVIELEKICQARQDKIKQYKKTDKDLHSKVHEWCVKYEKLQEQFNQKIKNEENTEAFKLMAKETIAKLKDTLSRLQRQKEEDHRKIERLQSELNQEREIGQGLQHNIALLNRRSSMNFRGSVDFERMSQCEEKVITSQDIYNQINAYCKGRSKQQIQKLKQKIAFLLS